MMAPPSKPKPIRMRPALLRLLPLLALCAAGPAAADLRIAVIGPMTGPYDVLGAQLRAGAEKAVADINAGGGIRGERLVLDVEDDACRAEDAVAAANRAIGRGDVFVVGHLCAGAAEAAAAVYAKNGTLAITPGVTANGFSDDRAGPTVFRLAARDDGQGAFLGSEIARRFADRRVAVLEDGSSYGKGLAEATRAAMNAAGKREALVETYQPGARDYRALAGRLVDDAIDAVVIGGWHNDIALILEALRARGSQAVVIGGDALATSEYRVAAGKAVAGTLFSFFTDWRLAPGTASTAEAIRAAGTEPEGYVLPAYAAVQLFAAAAATAEPRDGAGLAAALAGEETPTLIGPVSFDAKGDARLDFYALYRWNEQGFAPAD